MNYYSILFNSAKNKAIDIHFDQTYILYWEENGKCRCIDPNFQNRWLSVPELDGKHNKFSMVFK